MSRPDFWRDPAQPFVESRRARDSQACYAEHSHTSLSLGLVEGGQSVSRFERRLQPLRRGHVVGIPAGMPHACNPQPGGRWAYRMLYLDEAWVGGVLAEGGLPERALAAPRTLDEPGIFRALCAADEALRHSPDRAEAESRLIQCLLHVAGLPAEAPPPRLCGPALRRVQELLDLRCHESLPLARLAEASGLSRHHLVRAFRDAVGMTPHAWQLDRRIQRAKPLLRAGMPLAQVAQELGFADQSHFQRAFKRRVAATPGEYLQL